MGFKSGWCSHYSTCCENRKPSPTGQADSVKSAQCVDRCVVENGGCDGKRKCTSTRGVATCGNCRAPFINDGATGCKNPALKKDPCKTNNGGCHSKRKCTSTNGRVTCGNCPAGYRNNGVNSCTKVDPCKTNNGGCHSTRKCTSTNGRVTCGNCAAGYVNNGANSCTKVDPCKKNNGGCHSKRKCTSKNGKVTCGNCAAGYVNNGVNSCTKVDPCKTNNGGCHSKRKCTSTNGKVTCGNCAAGYVNNGVNGCKACFSFKVSNINACGFSNEGLRTRKGTNGKGMTIEECRAACRKNSACTGIQYSSKNPNCDLIVKNCDFDKKFKKSSGAEWLVESRTCFDGAVVDTCKTNNGGCDSKRKCTESGSFKRAPKGDGYKCPENNKNRLFKALNKTPKECAALCEKKMRSA